MKNNIFTTEKRYSVSDEGIVRLNDSIIGHLEYGPLSVFFTVCNSLGGWRINNIKSIDDILNSIDRIIRFDYDYTVPFLFDFNSIMIEADDEKFFDDFMHDINNRILHLKAEMILDEASIEFE